MEIMLECLNMTMFDLVIYLIQVLITAIIVGLPATYVGLYLLHLADCINEPSKYDWHIW